VITYRAEDVQWFEREVPYVPTNRERMNRRLTDAISHHDCVDLAKASERITVREAELPKCATIRGHNPDAQDERQRKFVLDRVRDWFRAELIFWLALSCIFAAGVIWMVAHNG
jgi:hypothetical protein